MILEPTPRQGCRAVSDIRRQADFSILALPVVFRWGKNLLFPFRVWFRSNPQIPIPVLQGQLLNNAPPLVRPFDRGLAFSHRCHPVQRQRFPR